MLNRLAFASASLVLLAGVASAADVPRRRPLVAAAPVVAAPVVSAPVAPVFTWTGFYLGTYTGGIALDGRIRTAGNDPVTAAAVGALAQPASLSSDGGGLINGGQIGYNVQFGAIVAGLEADLSYSSVRSREISLGAFNNPSFFRQDLSLFGTARGRVGLAFGEGFVYATGGLAFAELDSRVAFLDPNLAWRFAGRDRDTGFGYTVGGGVEFLLPPALQGFSIIGTLLGATALTVKAEYLYFDLGDRNVLVNALPAGAPGSYNSNFETSGHIGRIGFNYRFGT